MLFRCVLSTFCIRIYGYGYGNQKNVSVHVHQSDLQSVTVPHNQTVNQSSIKTALCFNHDVTSES